MKNDDQWQRPTHAPAWFIIAVVFLFWLPIAAYYWKFALLILPIIVWRLNKKPWLDAIPPKRTSKAKSGGKTKITIKRPRGM